LRRIRELNDLECPMRRGVLLDTNTFNAVENSHFVTQLFRDLDTTLKPRLVSNHPIRS
jgi:hypothetical protein